MNGKEKDVILRAFLLYWSYQWWHVPTVHLTHCDLLLGRRHGAHAERLCANGARADHPRQRN